MNKPYQPLTKEEIIKRFLLAVIGTIAFAAIMIFLGYGKIPIKPFLIGLAFVLPIMIIGLFIGLKYPSMIRNAFVGVKDGKQIFQYKSKLAYVYLILGIGTIIVNGFLIIFHKKEIKYYVQIGFGFIFLFYGIKQIKSK